MIKVRRQGRTYMRRLPTGMEANVHIRRYKCNKCDYSTDYPGNVRVHDRAVHERKTEAPAPINFKLKCDQCEEQMDSLSSFKNHQQIKHLKI